MCSFLLLPGLERIGEHALAGCAEYHQRFVALLLPPGRTLKPQVYRFGWMTQAKRRMASSTDRSCL
jgi:hypothetical protein